MAFKMTLWNNQGGQLVELPKNRLDDEQRLEEWIEADTGLVGLDVLIIGRQVSTPFGGRIDLLAMDSNGDIVIIELKRDRTPREVVAQILDYASWIITLSPHEIYDFAEPYLTQKRGKGLGDAFKDRFELELPETFNADHSMVIVASELDDSSERIIEYLSSRHALDINVVFFSCFQQDGRELIGRSWLLDPEQVEDRADERRRAPWSGYWYVNVGQGETRNWDDCRKYGFLSAGQGKQYSDPLKKLNVGAKVFAYMKGSGYVGYGEVRQQAVMARDFIPAGQDRKLFDLPLVQEGIKNNADNSDMSDWIVGMVWSKALDRDQARRFRGAFAVPNIVCKLRDPRTLDFLKREFGVTE
jgi:hypothetical protein